MCPRWLQSAAARQPQALGAGAAAALQVSLHLLHEGGAVRALEDVFPPLAAGGPAAPGPATPAALHDRHLGGRGAGGVAFLAADHLADDLAHARVFCGGQKTCGQVPGGGRVGGRMLGSTGLKALGSRSFPHPRVARILTCSLCSTARAAALHVLALTPYTWGPLRPCLLGSHPPSPHTCACPHASVSAPPPPPMYFVCPAGSVPSFKELKDQALCGQQAVSRLCITHA